MAKDRETGEKKELEAKRIMVAAGRTSNADSLRVQNAGVETTEAMMEEDGFAKAIGNRG